MTFAKWTRPHFQDDAETWSESDLAPTLNGWEQREGGEATPPVLVTDNEPMGLRKQSSAAGGPVMLGDAMPPLDTDAGNLSVLTLSTVASRARTSAWPASGPVYPASAAVSSLNSSGSCETCGHGGQSLKMFPDSLAPTEDEISSVFSLAWSSSGTVWRGEYWMRAGSESPSVAVVCSLSAVLETRAVPRRYWLSAKAAAGILRRATKRGKILPPRLQQALEALATDTATPGTAPT